MNKRLGFFSLSKRIFISIKCCKYSSTKFIIFDMWIVENLFSFFVMCYVERWFMATDYHIGGKDLFRRRTRWPSANKLVCFVVVAVVVDWWLIRSVSFYRHFFRIENASSNENALIRYAPGNTFVERNPTISLIIMYLRFLIFTTSIYH